MRQTRYFKQNVLQKRPYIKRAWCEENVRNPDFLARQAHGRIRYWRFIEELGKYLRVVTLEDGETLHNAFPDRSFKRPLS